MHDQPCRLVDHTKVLVLEYHAQVHRLGRKGQRLRCGAQFDPERLPRAHPHRRLANRLPLQLHCAIGQQLLQIAARELGDMPGQRAVEPVIMVLRADQHIAQLHRGVGCLVRRLIGRNRVFAGQRRVRRAGLRVRGAILFG